jgi:hypothetical protein
MLSLYIGNYAFVPGEGVTTVVNFNLSPGVLVSYLKLGIPIAVTGSGLVISDS